MTAKNRGREGFTLIELLVVIAIISILAAVIVPNIRNYMEKAKQSRAKQDIVVLAKQVKAYYLDHEGAFPKSLQVLETEKYLSQDLPTSPWSTPYRYGYRDGVKSGGGDDETGMVTFYDHPETRVGFIIWADQYESAADDGDDGGDPTPDPDPDDDDDDEGSVAGRPIVYYEERFE